MSSEYKVEDFNKVIEMLALQDQTNAKLDFAWRYHRTANDFCRSAIVELGEFLDHMGYKWWSSKEPDIKQAQMEVVDVWHFLEPVNNFV